MTKTFTFSSLNIHNKNGPITFEFMTKDGLLEVVDINGKLLVNLNNKTLFENAAVVYDTYTNHEIHHFNSNPSIEEPVLFDRECRGTVVISEFTKTSGWRKILPHSSTI